MLDCVVVGDVMMDLILKSDRKIVNDLEFEGTNYFSSSQVVPGGSGNVAAALSHLGGTAALIGKAGHDAYGSAYVNDLESLHILARIEYDNTVSTGFAVSIVEPGGHRTLLVSRGANDRLTPEEARRNLLQLEPAKFVYLSGYSLFNSPQREAILESGRFAKENGSRVVFDPGSSNLVKSLPQVFENAVDQCDILCANQSEARVLAQGLDESEYARLRSRDGKDVIIKTGPEGCIVSSSGTLSKLPGVHSNSLDTTGAGDAFLGALIQCLASGHDIKQAASFANWFAARTTEGLGPRHFPRKDDANQMLKSLQHEKILEK